MSATADRGNPKAVFGAPRRLSSRLVYENPWMRVREDQIVRPDGVGTLYGVVEKPDFALVIPRDDDGIWLVEQYRYVPGRRAWEFPQGSWSGPAKGDQAALAATELREETGFIAAELRQLGHLYPAYGFSAQAIDIFLATGLTPGPPEREPSEQDMVQSHFSDAEVATMIKTGEIVDAGTIAAFALLSLDASS